MTAKPRVPLADDHSILLAGISKLIEAQCEVVGTVTDGRALVAAAQQLKPDLIIVDIAMPLLNGMDAVRQLVQLLPDCKVFFLTMLDNPRYATATFKAGASGYLLKQAAALQLSEAIETILHGNHYLSPELMKPMMDQAVRAGELLPVKGDAEGLTPRQREVLQLIGEGKRTKDIAAVLNVSIKTVEFHKTCLMNALGLHTTAELMRFAIMQGLAQAEP